jgi:O-Antigen ligase
MRILFYFILIAGIGNVVLRPEIENPFTLYRFVAPIGLAVVFATRPMMVLKYLSVFAAFALYNFVLANAYSSDYSQLLPSIVHYFYLFILLVLMIDMKARYARFDQQYLRFVEGFYAFLLLNLLLEFFVGPYYPNLYVDDSDDGSLRAFFWNQNDLAVVLCLVTWFALTLDRFRGPIRFLVTALTILLLYFNDSKAALFSLLFVSLPVYFILRLCAAVRVPPGVWYLLFSSLFALALVILNSVSEIDINFANGTYTLGELLVRPIVNIVTLQPSGEPWGSLNNRTDAAIFVIIEYLKSYGFGLGAGGSWLVLTFPQYELRGAQSPHNALLQFTVDFGFPVLLSYLSMVVWAVRRLFRHRLGQDERLKVIAILSFPMAGLSQSGAIITNFFFFAGVFFIWLIGTNTPVRRTALSPTTKVARPSWILPTDLRVGTA